jgi:hypothetical protein
MKKMVTSPLWTKKKVFFMCEKTLFFTSKKGENENFSQKICLKKTKSGISAVFFVFDENFLQNFFLREKKIRYIPTLTREAKESESRGTTQAGKPFKCARGKSP